MFGSGLLALQCSDPLAEDCSLTLSCGDQPRYSVDDNCRWVDPNGTPWAESPIYDHMEQRWEWRDGTPTETQDFGCIPDMLTGNGGSGGSLGSDGGTGLGGSGPTLPETHCSRTGCSPGLACDTTSGNCVGCTEQSQCPVGFCNINSHNCAQCITDEHCTNPLAAHCAADVCGACTSNAQCSKFAGRGLCVDGVCGECDDNTDCTGNTNGSQCNTTTHACVQCTGDEQCTDPTASHCGPDSTCVACTEASQCEGDTNQCRTTDGRCVQCLAPEDCGSVTAALCNADGLCAECADNMQCARFTTTPVCDTTKTPNTCVECVTDDDCDSDTAPHCVNNACQACNVNADCAGQPSGNTVCDVSANPNQCVKCTGVQTGAGAAAVGGFAACSVGGQARVCDSANKICSAFSPGTATQPCDACVSDAHCAAANFCVPQAFGGQNVGNFCVPQAAAGQSPCAGLNEFRVPASIDSLDRPMVNVCLLMTTTCAGRRDLLAPKVCTASTECGVPNLDDGVCAPSTSGMLCTIPCSDGFDCAGQDCERATAQSPLLCTR